MMRSVNDFGSWLRPGQPIAYSDITMIGGVKAGPVERKDKMNPISNIGVSKLETDKSLPINLDEMLDVLIPENTWFITRGNHLVLYHGFFKRNLLSRIYVFKLKRNSKEDILKYLPNGICLYSEEFDLCKMVEPVNNDAMRETREDPYDARHAAVDKLIEQAKRTREDDIVEELLKEAADKADGKMKDMVNNLNDSNLKKYDNANSSNLPDPRDPWVHRSKGMSCKTCMWFVLKQNVKGNSRIGRCRRHAPTMNGYPVVYVADWCGDHKLDEETD